jgi:hypothetical protein
MAGTFTKDGNEGIDENLSTKFSNGIVLYILFFGVFMVTNGK